MAYDYKTIMAIAGLIIAVAIYIAYRIAHKHKLDETICHNCGANKVPHYNCRKCGK